VTVLSLRGVGLTRDGRDLLDGVDWDVQPGRHWVLLGANGSGKTSLVRIASLYEHPSRGTVEVLGERLGATDVRRLRRRISLVSPAMADLVRPQLTAAEVVVCAKYAALEPWWHEYTDDERTRARAILQRLGIERLADRPFSTFSSGERQRVLLARTLMNDPGLILLDEPTAALDLAGREELVASLDDLAHDPATPPIVLVTHHVEEIPPGFTHVLMLRDGAVLAAGPIATTLTEANLSACFGLDVALEERHGRYAAWARR
jgi:iron complex transport system ATP-binding protein